MEIVNNKTENPIRIYQEKFKNMDPVSMACRTECTYEIEEGSGRGRFEIAFMNRKVFMFYPSMESYFDDGSKTSDYVRIILARFLMEGVSVPEGKKMLSYSQLPNGPVYERQFKGRCINRIAGIFGNRISDFEYAMEKIGGTKALDEKGRFAGGADSAYNVEFIPNFTVRILIWEPDEEFGATAQFLFSDNFSVSFTSDDVAVIGDIIIDELRKS